MICNMSSTPCKGRQTNLEDSLLEVMERREQLQSQEAEELELIEGLHEELAAEQRARDESLAEIDGGQQGQAQRRAGLLAALEPDLAALYEQQLAAAGVGAGVLQGRRCGACRIELDRGELARISAADDDEVLRCPECRAILLTRQKGRHVKVVVEADGGSRGNPGLAGYGAVVWSEDRSTVLARK